jgi:hypothetical protein
MTSATYEDGVRDALKVLDGVEPQYPVQVPYSPPNYEDKGAQALLDECRQAVERLLKK